MPDIFINSDHFRNGDIKQALISTYLEIDEMLRKPEHADELNRMKAKSANSNSNGMGLEAVDQQESVGSGLPNCHNGRQLVLASAFLCSCKLN